MAVLKHILWFLAAIGIYFVCILLVISDFVLALHQSLFSARLVALLPFIIPGILAVFLWKKSPAFAAGVGVCIIHAAVDILM